MSDVLLPRDTTTPKSGAMGKGTVMKSPLSLDSEGAGDVMVASGGSQKGRQPTLAAMVDQAVSAVALAEELAEVKGAVAALANPKVAQGLVNTKAHSPKRSSRIPRLGIAP